MKRSYSGALKWELEITLNHSALQKQFFSFLTDALIKNTDFTVGK